MPAEQDRMRNPFGMDETCHECENLVESRSRIVHGYGDVTAEFLFVTERPTSAADGSGVPFAVTQVTDPIRIVLRRSGFLSPDRLDIEGNPVVENVYLTHVARCRHPDRTPTDREVANCDAFLNAEIRTINPEILVPIGDRALEVVADEFTTRDPSQLSAIETHATPIRGRGFELLPMVARDALTDERIEAFVGAIRNLSARDYRQTKGRQRR